MPISTRKLLWRWQMSPTPDAGVPGNAESGAGYCSHHTGRASCPVSEQLLTKLIARNFVMGVCGRVGARMVRVLPAGSDLQRPSRSGYVVAFNFARSVTVVSEARL